MVETLLRNDGVGGVCRTCSESDVGHDSNEGVLLHVEGARVETPFDTKGVELTPGHDEIPTQTDGIGHQLRNEGRDDDLRRAHGEQHVHARTERHHEHTNGPGADRIGRHINIIVADGGTDFGIW